MNITKLSSLKRSIRRYALRWVAIKAHKPGFWDCRFAQKDSGVRGGNYRNVRDIILSNAELEELRILKLLRQHRNTRG